MYPQNYPPPQFVPVPQRRPARFSAPVVISIVIAVIACLGLGGYWLYRSASQAVQSAAAYSDQFLVLMQQHQFDAANAMLVPEAQMRTPAHSMRSIVALVEENHGTLIGWNKPSWYIQDFNGAEYVQLTYRLHCSRSDTTAQVVVERTGNIWAIYSFQYAL